MIKKLVTKLQNHYIAQCNYIKYYEKYKLDERIILLESQQSKEFAGNIYYLIKELAENPEYSKYDIYLSIAREKMGYAKKFYSSKGINNVKFVESNTGKYYKAISKAKYLINDNTFLPFFIKKEGQVYLNTWHGTPLKTLGKKINNDLHNIGNAQKNFVVADYLLYPNEYTKKHMVEDYMLENLSDNTILLEGYPRNQAFFDTNLQKEIRREYELVEKQVIAYMPTWRGTLSGQNSQVQQMNLEYILEEFDERLSENQVVYVNLHPIEKAKVDFSPYKKVKPFPEKYETYEFLNATDMLITDYSSVFFDYLNTGKKIILYTYDKESYLEDRGVYRNLEEFPFPIVENMNDLIKEINLPKEYDDSKEKSEFCAYDSINASKKICERVILQKKSDVLEVKMPDNGKKNVFIFAGRLANNGITASLKNLIFSIDRTKYNYFLLVDTRGVRNSLDQLRKLSKYVNYYTVKGKMNLTLGQKILTFLYNKDIIKTEKYLLLLQKAYQYEFKREFGDGRIDTLIHFTGYATKKINLFSQFKGNNIIYVHSDMRKEAKLKGKQRLDVLKHAYNNYDKVVVVTPDMKRITAEISQNKSNIYTCKNIIDHTFVREKSKEEILLDENTVVYPNENSINTFFDSDSVKFINVGRFSEEKGQLRLLNAFANLHKDNENIKLVIVGGYSDKDYYNIIISRIEELNLTEHVLLIKSISNPFPIVKKCDYFVLSSFYEGFGLVIAEADILGKPLISTNIPGPRGFMKRYGGTMVEDSEEGIYKGMCMLLNGEINPMNADYEQYNAEAIEEFESLL